MIRLEEKYLDFKDEYTEKINKRIDEAWPFIIESFVEYYGEEHRNIINERLEDVLFVYYVSDFLINYCINEYIDNIKKLENMNKEIFKILEIKGTDSEILDNKTKVLEFIFGNKCFLNSNLNNLKILSFDKEYEYLANDDEKKDFIKELFNKDSLTVNDREKIEKCIEYILNNLENVKTCEKKLKKIIEGVKISRYIVNTDVYKEYVEEKNSKINNFYELASLKLIGLSTDEALKYNVLKNYIYAMILREKNYNPFELSLPIDDDFLVKLIGLPIFLTDDDSLIHELNHAVRTVIIAKKLYNKKNSIFDNYVIKSGINLKNIELFKKTEELLASISGLEIYNIFRSKYKKVIFDDNILDEEILENENILLIEKFFNIYRNVINHDSIGTDLELLFSYIGEENFNRLAEFINLNYDEVSSSDNNTELDIILNDMKRYSKKRILKQ